MFSCDNVKELIAFMCAEFNITEETAYDRILKKNPDILPAKMVKELVGAVKKTTTKIFATKKSEALAQEYGLEPKDIQFRTGKNNTITMPDVKMAYQLKGKSNTPKKTTKPTPEPTPEPTEEIVLEDEDELELDE